MRQNSVLSRQGEENAIANKTTLGGEKIEDLRQKGMPRLKTHKNQGELKKIGKKPGQIGIKSEKIGKRRKKINT